MVPLSGLPSVSAGGRHLGARSRFDPTLPLHDRPNTFLERRSDPVTPSEAGLQQPVSRTLGERSTATPATFVIHRDMLGDRALLYSSSKSNGATLRAIAMDPKSGGVAVEAARRVPGTVCCNPPLRCCVQAQTAVAEHVWPVHVVGSVGSYNRERDLPTSSPYRGAERTIRLNTGSRLVQPESRRCRERTLAQWH